MVGDFITSMDANVVKRFSDYAMVYAYNWLSQHISIELIWVFEQTQWISSHNYECCWCLLPCIAISVICSMIILFDTIWLIEFEMLTRLLVSWFGANFCFSFVQIPFIHFDSRWLRLWHASPIFHLLFLSFSIWMQ